MFSKLNIKTLFKGFVLASFLSVAPVMALATPASELQATLIKAQQGDGDAQLNLGMMYANGDGVKKDDKKAFAWCKKAADQGNTR